MGEVSTAYSRHELSAIWPDMSADEFQALEDHILSEGQQKPIVILDGQVLDGWHRYRACLALGHVPIFEDFPGSLDDARGFVIGSNAMRRHLTAGQRAQCIVKVHEWSPKGRPEFRGKCAVPAHLPNREQPMSSAELAALAGTSIRTVVLAKQAERAGMGNLVREGKISLSEATGGRPRRVPSTPETPVCGEGSKSTEEADQAMQILRDQMEEMRSLANETLEENEKLQDRLAAAHLTATPEERAGAEQRFAELRQQLAQSELVGRATAATRDHVQGEHNELIRSYKALQRQNKRLREENNRLQEDISRLREGKEVSP